MPDVGERGTLPASVRTAEAIGLVPPPDGTEPVSSRCRRDATGSVRWAGGGDGSSGGPTWGSSTGRTGRSTNGSPGVAEGTGAITARSGTLGTSTDADGAGSMWGGCSG